MWSFWLVLLLLILLLAALPQLQRHGWGYSPSAILALMLLVVLALMWFGVIAFSWPWGAPPR